MTEAIAVAIASKADLPDEVREILHEGLSFDGDCVLLRYYAESNPHLTVSKFQDETAFEAFVNKIYIEASTVSEAVSIGLTAVDALVALVERGVDRPCRVVLSIDDRNWPILDADQAEDEVEIPPSASLRFHVRRDGEEWIDTHLENYRQPVLMRDVTPLAT